MFCYIRLLQEQVAPSHPTQKMILADSPFCVSFVEQVNVEIWKLSLVTGTTAA